MVNNSPIIGVISNPIEKLSPKYDHVFKECIQLNLGIMNAQPSTRYLFKKQETDRKEYGCTGVRFVQFLPHSQWCNSFWAGPQWPCSKAVYKPVWHIPLLSVEWMNSWWRTEELSETCRVSCQNKFVKLVQLVGFITKKFVTMHGHTNIKFMKFIRRFSCWYLLLTTEFY